MHLEVVLFDRPPRRNCPRDFPDQSDLVPPLELESFLRQGFCRSHFQRTGAAVAARFGRAIRDHQSQRQAERRITRASANGDRSLEKRPDSASRVSAGSTINVAKTFYPGARLVYQGPSRRRKVAVAQLSG